MHAKPLLKPDLKPPEPALLDGAALFLDFDGTLVEIAPTPDQVRVDARVERLMGRLSRRLDGRLAVISGRSASEIRRLFVGAAGPFHVSGSHGLELMWSDGRSSAPKRPDALSQDDPSLAALAAEHPGVVVERKPLGLALHYRLAPEAEQACRRFAERLSRGEGLSLQEGKMMIEVRAGGGDKGVALATFMSDPSMAGARPVFLGDDLTDEPAFSAAAALGGSGVLVGPYRETAAGYRLSGVADALEWLERACEALS